MNYENLRLFIELMNSKRKKVVNYIMTQKKLKHKLKSLSLNIIFKKITR